MIVRGLGPGDWDPSPSKLGQRLLRELKLTTIVTSFVTKLTKRVISDPPFRFV
jgi:hypothetical protein